MKRTPFLPPCQPAAPPSSSSCSRHDGLRSSFFTDASSGAAPVTAERLTQMYPASMLDDLLEAEDQQQKRPSDASTLTSVDTAAAFQYRCVGSKSNLQ